MVDSAFQKTMLRILPPTNWSQIFAEIPLLLVIMSHREWDSGEDGLGEKGGGSQMSVTEDGSEEKGRGSQTSVTIVLCSI